MPYGVWRCTGTGQASDTTQGPDGPAGPTGRAYPRPVAGGGAHNRAAQKVVIAGSSGLIGTALCASYRYGGHEVIRLVRREPTAADERRWDPADPDPSLVDDADVLVNLAGSPLTGRWTRARVDLIRSSRITTATALRTMVERADTGTVFLSASGIRWYGVDRGDEVLWAPLRAGLGWSADEPALVFDGPDDTDLWPWSSVGLLALVPGEGIPGDE